MPWVKLDDQFFSNPKVLRAGRDARDLYLASLTYCARHLTDGVLPAEDLPDLGIMADIAYPSEAAVKLVHVGLWKAADAGHGYCIADWVGCSVVHPLNTQQERATRAYDNWRIAVLKRDGFTCVHCGARNPLLHAHHIKHWSTESKDRFSVTNGLTLCTTCHSLVHGRRV